MKYDYELKYLKSLAMQYPNIASASTEIINLQSILNLPKGTEHFLTDIHGEYEQFLHVLKNGSGSVRRKIDEEFGNTISSRDKKSLATLIYYPKLKLDLVEKTEENLEDWYTITLHRLVQICKRVASKYTRSKVRKALPKDFAYVIEELITEKEEIQDKEAYYNSILSTIIRIGSASDFIIAMSNLIQRLVVDHIHIVGDIFDRGPGPHIIMDTLINHHSVDIQWGNHDVVWMGAASGHMASIANVIRITARYGNLDMLEEGYGINLIPLANFAMNVYGNDKCSCFNINYNADEYNTKDLEWDCRMQKAIAVIQFKLEGQLIMRRPEFAMESRLLLDKMDLSAGTVVIEGETYELKDTDFPTIDPEHPYELSDEEREIMERLQTAFMKCEKLQKHIRFLYSHGSMYKVYNSNLLYHGCVPLNEDGSFREVEVFGKKYSGKALYDILEVYARKGYYAVDKEEKSKGQDILWYIWSNGNSPVFGKDKMTTFERYLVADSRTHHEEKNPYYTYIEKVETVNKILEEFGLDTENSHIINGHMPVQLSKGETPVKCNGKLFIIDGGFSKAYQKVTGIAGYTLVYNSYGLRLVAHDPFVSVEDAIANESDIHSESMIVETVRQRRLVADTDIGQELSERIQELEHLLEAYRQGAIIEKM
ncbi:fructose-1,6-bisphosphatase [Murimonas intestini]|uniref:Fructose-1,6-bisphosphatase class 3 n=1 Tax=Murimonas intestini TaxID=1337051 RepID=A0AB73T459_9FIRM|nr:fructose-1,6-bisphosphatase [Murimonas intestini]MCR1841123.1 fructose-1,6-bisphosphatase [Murimonas intestini]MCR1865760.1 fructose-1,6-bisphosphatase [Murimonas intestini]MCR1883180.1 fructose-1,6-bisphosphatase [Murimonas intestini]